jgi:hypothetical protein
MAAFLLRLHPCNERLPRCYGLVVTAFDDSAHWVAPIPLNHLLRWALAIWMRLRNPIPPGDPDVLGLRLLAQSHDRRGYRDGILCSRPAGTALVYTHPTPAMVATAWGVHADAEELAQQLLWAAIDSGPDAGPEARRGMRPW